MSGSVFNNPYFNGRLFNAEDHVKAIADSVTISDSIGKAFGMVQSDSMAVADVLGKAGAKPIADSVAVTDSISKAVAKALASSFTYTDSISKALGKVQSDSVAITDTISKGVGKVRADTVAVVDTLSKAVNKARADTVTIADAIVVTYVHLRNFADRVIISDAIEGWMSTKTHLRRVISRMDTARMAVSRMPLWRWIRRKVI